MLHIIMLDCTLIFRVKTSKTVFPWSKNAQYFRLWSAKKRENAWRANSFQLGHTRAHIAPTETQTQLAVSAELVPVKRNQIVASDKTCEKLITRKVLCFPVSKLDLILDALDLSLDTRSSSFDGLSTYIWMVLYLLCTLNSLYCGNPWDHKLVSLI